MALSSSPPPSLLLLLSQQQQQQRLEEGPSDSLESLACLATCSGCRAPKAPVVAQLAGNSTRGEMKEGSLTGCRPTRASKGHLADLPDWPWRRARGWPRAEATGAETNLISWATDQTSVSPPLPPAAIISTTTAVRRAKTQVSAVIVSVGFFEAAGRRSLASLVIDQLRAPALRNRSPAVVVMVVAVAQQAR